MRVWSRYDGHSVSAKDSHSQLGREVFLLLAGWMGLLPEHILEAGELGGGQAVSSLLARCRGDVVSLGWTGICQVLIGDHGLASAGAAGASGHLKCVSKRGWGRLWSCSRRGQDAQGFRAPRRAANRVLT